MVSPNSNFTYPNPQISQGQPDFVAKARLVSNVTNARNAVVTTTEDHGYQDGYVVTLIVPQAYGMYIPFKNGTITVISPTSFEININTLPLKSFVAPTYPPAFTPAQVIPISGFVGDNIAQ